MRSAVRSVNPAAPAGRSEQLLREAAWRLEHGYPTGSAAVRSAIADVLRAALDELAGT